MTTASTAAAPITVPAIPPLDRLEPGVCVGVGDGDEELVVVVL